MTPATHPTGEKDNLFSLFKKISVGKVGLHHTHPLRDTTQMRHTLPTRVSLHQTPPPYQPVRLAPAHLLSLRRCPIATRSSLPRS